MTLGPREIITPFRPIPLAVPDGMKPNEFFNSTENLNDLVQNNGLLITLENNNGRYNNIDLANLL